MMLKYTLLISMLVFLAGTLRAQSDKFGYGFRAGLNVAQYDGPSEIGPNGEKLESNKSASGFHIGATFSYKFGDLMGIRTELIYSQRGTDYLYEGPSYYYLGANSVTPITLSGKRTQSINIGNSYIDVPFSFYYKIKGFELSAGANFGFLISSNAGGNLKFEGKSPITGNAIVPFNILLDYNYKSDKGGEASSTTQNVNVDGRIYTVPISQGAYYDFPQRDKDMFQTVDVGLYGLGDVDRNEYDISLQKLNPDKSFMPRQDINKSKAWEFSVGFSF
jgi:hypothetical protein